jgi:hypothetical protein
MPVMPANSHITSDKHKTDNHANTFKKETANSALNVHYYTSSTEDPSTIPCPDNSLTQPSLPVALPASVSNANK